jgi:phage terminase large subunit
VDTAWDLGYGDRTAIWFVQAYGGFYNFIDYLEGTGRTIADYLVDLQNKRYLYGLDFVPHDATDAILHKNLSASREMSIDMLMRKSGRKVRVIPKLHVMHGINAARTFFSQCRFDEEKTADGIVALRNYQWGPLNEHGVTKRSPLHNWASHAADAFRGAALAVKQPKGEEEQLKQFVEPPRRLGSYTPFA